jgi:hypothetical protein
MRLRSRKTAKGYVVLAIPSIISPSDSPVWLSTALKLLADNLESDVFSQSSFSYPKTFSVSWYLR